MAPPWHIREQIADIKIWVYERRKALSYERSWGPIDKVLIEKASNEEDLWNVYCFQWLKKKHSGDTRQEKTDIVWLPKRQKEKRPKKGRPWKQLLLKALRLLGRAVAQKKVNWKNRKKIIPKKRETFRRHQPTTTSTPTDDTDSRTFLFIVDVIRFWAKKSQKNRKKRKTS